MHMKKATNITLATLAAALLASSCIKEADPYDVAIWMAGRAKSQAWPSLA